jgi:hypothetical protein
VTTRILPIVAADGLIRRQGEDDHGYGRRSAVRFRDEKPGDLDRARAAVAAWRDGHPAGTSDDLIAAVGPAFQPDWAIVLRGVLVAEDRHRARRTTGTVTGNAGQIR